MVPFPKEVNETSREPLPSPKAFDRMLDESKGTDKETEDDGLQKGGINQRLVFKATTEAEHISDHNDFCKNQCFDHGHPVIRVRDIMSSQNESSVLRESGKHKAEINTFIQYSAISWHIFFFKSLFSPSGLLMIYGPPSTHHYPCSGDQHYFESERMEFFPLIQLSQKVVT